MTYSTVMLSYGYWQRRFGGDPSVVGQTLTVDGRPKKVVGVMPERFRIVNADAELIFPLSFDVTRFTLTGFNYQGVARLRPGITIAQANADVARMIPVWMQSWSDGPGTRPRSYETWDISPDLRPLKAEVIGGMTDVLWVVMKQPLPIADDQLAVFARLYPRNGRPIQPTNGRLLLESH